MSIVEITNERPNDLEHESRLLIVAIQDKNIDGVASLLEKGADVNVSDERGFTSLMYAMHSSNIEILKLLLQRRDINVNARNCTWDTALTIGVSSGATTEALELLINAGADVNATNYFGHSSIHCATRPGCRHAIKILMKHGAKVKMNEMIARDKDILHNESGKKSSDYSPPILQNFGKLYEEEPRHHTSQIPRNNDMEKNLISEAERISLKDNVFQCISQGDLRSLSKLEGWSLEMRDTNGLTPLLVSIKNDMYDIADYLLRLGADVNAHTIDNKGRTPLMEALFISKKDVRYVKRLLMEKEINLEEEDFDGATALILAAEFFGSRVDKSILPMLINVGANINAKRFGGISALNITSKFKSLRDARNILLEAGALP